MSFGDTKENSADKIEEHSKANHKKKLSRRDLILIIVFACVVFFILLTLGIWKHRKHNLSKKSYPKDNNLGNFVYKKYD